MRRVRDVLLFCMVLCLLYCVPAFADDWEVFVPDPEGSNLDDPDRFSDRIPVTLPPSLTVDDFDSWEDWEEYLYGDEIPVEDDRPEASPSNAQRRATPSNAPVMIQPMANYNNPYDGTISTTIVQYFSDVIPKLGNVDYVLFRSGQYQYRMVYADEIVLNGNTFTAVDARYVVYDSRYYTWSFGNEGAFSLRAGNYLVYANVGDYPVLARDHIGLMTLAFMGAVFLVFTICRSFFSPARMTL